MNNNHKLYKSQLWEIKAALMLKDMEIKSEKFIDTDLFCVTISLPKSTIRQENGDIMIHDVYLNDRHFMAITTGNTHLITRMS
ncbi:hypothetical protein [Raoultella terrigena]|uniref:hypothetical protein n=1 Tax=Raoultella terrigena TaxID=577 RepID=UPI001F2FB2B4|nr:hypothetical protein [Raoultella terrigena]